MPDAFNVYDYLAFVWWLIKVMTFVVSIALNVILLVVLSQARSFSSGCLTTTQCITRTRQ